MKRFGTLSTIVLLTMITGFASNADAKLRNSKTISVVQRNPVLKALRVEITPVFGVSLNESLTSHIFVGGKLNFHILEYLFIGGSYQHYFGRTTDLFREAQTDYEVFPEKRITKWAAFGHIGYAPVYGKFALFNSYVVHFDVYVFVGAGVTRTTGNRVTGVFGVGQRMFINKFLAINWELKDQLYQEKFNAGKSFVNNVVFTLGLSMFIPFGFKYRGLK